MVKFVLFIAFQMLWQDADVGIGKLRMRAETRILFYSNRNQVKIHFFFKSKEQAIIER